MISDNKAITDIYNEALRRLNGDIAPLHWGPAHVVWEDSNFDFAEDCLKEFDQNKMEFSAEQLDVVRWSLEELIKIPIETRKYDDWEYSERDDEDE